MSMPPDQMAQSMPPQGVSPPPSDTPGMPSAAPLSGPMSTPEPADGQKQAGVVNIHMAISLLEQALPMLGSQSDEGQLVLTSLKSLSKHFGSSGGKELVPSELKMLMQQQGGQSGPPPTPDGAGAPAGQPVPPMGA